MQHAVFYVLVVIFALPNLWAIYHSFHHRFPTTQERLIWICLGIFVPVIGGLAYLFFGRRRATGKLFQ